jgi:excisionase family DNA binding protein
MQTPDIDKLPGTQLLNWEQCCAVLGVSKSTFYNLVNMGQIPALRTGPRAGIKVRVDSLRAYLSTACVEA